MIKHKLTKKEYDKLYNKTHRQERNEYQRILNKRKPWISHLYDARKRCNNPNTQFYYLYGERGIECRITPEEVKKLWFRDKAYLLTCSSIDRINNDGHYEYNNCRFIEMTRNSSRANSRKIIQYSVGGIYIREWNSLKSASEYYQISHSAISNAIKRNNLSCGFIWRYKE